jgi:hypothetical protein
VGPRATLHAVANVKKKILTPVGNPNSVRPARGLYIILTELPRIHYFIVFIIILISNIISFSVISHVYDIATAIRKHICLLHSSVVNVRDSISYISIRLR